MSQSWVIPGYVYGPTTTLQSLWDQYLNANKGMITNTALAKHFKVELTTMNAFMEGTDAGSLHSLSTRYVNVLRTVTGIDMDRYIVCVAKQGVMRRCPELADNISFTTWTTRKEIVEVLRPYTQRYGCPNVDIQIGVPSGTTSHWLSGHQNPSGDTLELLLIAITRGLNEGTTDDVVMWKVATSVFGMTLEELLPGMKTFRDTVVELLSPFSHRDAPYASAKTGIKSNTIVRLRNFTKTKDGVYNVQSETVLLILEVLLKTRRPELALHLANVRERFLKGKPVEKPAVTTSPVVLADEKKEAKPIRASKNARLAALHRQMAAILEEEEAPSNIVETTRTLNQEIGETLDGLKHCLTGVNFTPRPGEPISKETVAEINRMTEGLRRVLHLLAQSDPNTRLAAFHEIASGIDELFVTNFALQFPDIFGATRIVQATRQQLTANRKKS